MKSHIFTDGATLGHNGPLGTVKKVGLGIFCQEPRIEIAEKVDGGSNNEAEFMALIRGMEEAIRLKITDVHYYLDSQIVWRRAACPKKGKKNIYFRPKGKQKNERMDAFQDTVLGLAANFKRIEFSWIPREENSMADFLSKKALE